VFYTSRSISISIHLNDWPYNRKVFAQGTEHLVSAKHPGDINLKLLMSDVMTSRIG